MAKITERNSHATCGDTVNLRLRTYNANSLQNVESIEKVDIYYIDPVDGERLVETIEASEIQNPEVGNYLLPLVLTNPKYVIGNYIDAWTLQYEDIDTNTSVQRNSFSIIPNKWFSTTQSPVYDFSVSFLPNKIVKGSKRSLLIKITPNVSKGSDMTPYYENLFAVSDIKINMAMVCGECVPAESDLRLVVDGEAVDHREKFYGYYFLDTSDMDEGIYHVWFEINFAENTYITEKNALQIFS